MDTEIAGVPGRLFARLCGTKVTRLTFKAGFSDDKATVAEVAYLRVESPPLAPASRLYKKLGESLEQLGWESMESMDRKALKLDRPSAYRFPASTDPIEYRAYSNGSLTRYFAEYCVTSFYSAYVWTSSCFVELSTEAPEEECLSGL